MRLFLLAGAWGVFVCMGAAVADNAATKPKPKAAAVVMNAADIKWGDAPPVFSKGAQLAVLRGDPFKKGPYSIRFKMPDGYKIAPHWHTLPEELTVLSGNFALTMDDGTHELSAGAYHFLPGHQNHSVVTKGETILQINAMGPFDMHYLNDADDPSKTPAAQK
jgi:quercetin dioxygenase-like cupin family protein